MTTRVAAVDDAPAVAALVTQLGYDAPADEVSGRLARLLARPTSVSSLPSSTGV